MNKELLRLLRKEREALVESIDAIDKILAVANSDDSDKSDDDKHTSEFSSKNGDITWPKYTYEALDSLGGTANTASIFDLMIRSNPKIKDTVVRRQASNHLSKLVKRGILEGRAKSRSKKDGRVYTIINRQKAIDEL